MKDTPQRIRPISDAERDDATEAMFALMTGGSDDPTQMAALRTLARHPSLGQRFLKFNLHLLTKTSLPLRLRQLITMRIGWTRRSDYIWASHARLSLQIGLEEADIMAIREGAGSPHWSKFERAVILAIDQLVAQSDIDDTTWTVLADELDDRQLMDFLFTVGGYVTLAMAFNTMRIARDPVLEPFIARYGSPS